MLVLLIIIKVQTLFLSACSAFFFTKRNEQCRGGSGISGNQHHCYNGQHKRHHQENLVRQINNAGSLLIVFYIKLNLYKTYLTRDLPSFQNVKCLSIMSNHFRSVRIFLYLPNTIINIGFIIIVKYNNS